MKILCVFYGIGRGLDISEPSINDKMLKPLVQIGNTVDSIYILNEKKRLENHRSDEYGDIPPVEEGVFNKSRIIRTNAAFLLDQELFNLSKKYEDRYNDNFTSYSNLICQLSKLELASKSIDFNNYDKVILCRDDIAFLTHSINWNKIINVSDFGPVVSLWHWHAGISERFVLCSPDAAKIICNRKDLICEFLDNYNCLHSESLQFFCFKKYELTPYACNIKLARCRIKGRLHKENFRIPIWRPHETFRMVLAFLRFLCQN